MKKEEACRRIDNLDYYMQHYTSPDYGERDHEAMMMAKKALEQEPKKGHWIETAEEYYKAINEKGGGVNDNTPYFVEDIACSECLTKFCIVENEVERFDFCPNCGAEMSEVEE